MFRNKFCLLLFALFYSYWLGAQDCPTTAILVKTKAAYLESARTDSLLVFVNLRTAIPGVRIRMPYATTDNFTGVKLYPSETALLRTAPARALRKVQEVLQKQGLGLCIFDAYRPFRVTCTMWRKAKDRHYVANPMKASKHNRGLAVDLTICERTTGRELDMGTAFDSFTDTAHHTFMALPADVLARRRLLRTVMAQAGFTSIPSEWWHYNWPDPENKYDALDLPFSDLLTQ